MAGRAMNVRILPLLIAFALASCGKGAPDAAPPLAGAAIGGPFSLIDQDGKPVTEANYAGRYRAIYFGYSFCPDVCPTTLLKLMQGTKAFAAKSPALAGKLVPIFITVDPDRDTPPILKQYVAAFGPGLVGLTGTPAEIARVAKEYGTYYKKQPVAAGASGYMMDHSSQVILFGPAGKPIVLLPADQSGDAVAQTLSDWVR
jgi:protein SCO1/2